MRGKLSSEDISSRLFLIFIHFNLIYLGKRLSTKGILTLAGVAQWTECGLWTKRSPVQFPVRAHAWVVGQVPSGGQVRGNHTLIFLSLSFSLPSPLSKNKKIKSFLKRVYWRWFARDVIFIQGWLWRPQVKMWISDEYWPTHQTHAQSHTNGHMYLIINRQSIMIDSRSFSQC